MMSKTSDELDSILTILRKHNVMSFAGKLLDMEFSVTIGPEPVVIDGNTSVTPGGWKSKVAERLDDPDKLFEYDKEPKI